MSPLSLDNFLHSLIRHVAAAAALNYTATPRAVFRNQIHEAGSVDDTLSAFRIYGGPGTVWEAVPAASVQCESVSLDPAVALARGQKLFEGLLNAEGRPVSMLTINGFRASDDAADGTWQIKGLVFIQRPGLVGLDAKNRNRATFNFDCWFAKLT